MLLPLKTPEREDEREGGIYLRQSLPYDPFEGRLTVFIPSVAICDVRIAVV